MKRSQITIAGTTLDITVTTKYSSRATKTKIKIAPFNFDDARPELSRKELKEVAQFAAFEWCENYADVDFKKMAWNSKEQEFTLTAARSDAPVYHLVVRVYPEGYNAAQIAREEESMKRWRETEERQNRQEAEALAEGKRIMETHAEFRITELEVEIEGNVFQVIRTLSWSAGDTDLFRVRALTRFNTKPVYPTNAERAALAVFDTTVMV